MREKTFEILTRLSTGIMLFAFLSIVISTTFSEAQWVVGFAKAMYWLIIATALFSIGIWGTNKYLSHSEASDENVSNENENIDGESVHK